MAPGGEGCHMTATAARAPTSFTRRVNNSEEVLLSKITAPSRPDWIVRRMRIERHITTGTARSLTVVTGPPGAGKTTAVASWAAGPRGLGHPRPLRRQAERVLVHDRGSTAEGRSQL